VVVGLTPRFQVLMLRIVSTADAEPINVGSFLVAIYVLITDSG